VDLLEAGRLLVRTISSTFGADFILLSALREVLVGLLFLLPMKVSQVPLPVPSLLELLQTGEVHSAYAVMRSVAALLQAI
jgi:hypothetical protein